LNDEMRTISPVNGHELATSQLLAVLPREALVELAARGARRRYAAGETVFSEGDESRSLHVVREGALDVLRDEDGRRSLLQKLRPGDVVGELGVLDHRPRSATVIAREASETLEVDGDALSEALARHPDAARRMLGVLARLLTDSKEQVTRENWQLERRVRERTQDLRRSQLEIVFRLGQVAESRDPETGRHITRMSRLSARLAEAAGMPPDECEALLHAAPMHDIGKVGVPDSILHKAGPLEPGEWETMRRHTTIGAEILTNSRSPVVRMAEEIALTHHERWDGSGYPRGLRGEEIPLVGRICAVSDVFDALVSTRPYKPAWPIDEALAELERRSGTLFDPTLVDLMRGLHDELPGIIAGDGDLASAELGH
jgi:HD-GYP domain-containing protein (c-di-GMP phosphodiesterase class II)